jgi:hypothetical protein
MKKFTEKDFFDSLKETCDIIEWKLVMKLIWGKIKDKKSQLYAGSPFCPITAVFYQIKEIYRYPISAYPSGKELGLSQEFVDSIVRAADGEENPERKQLLKALKLGTS